MGAYVDFIGYASTSWPDDYWWSRAFVFAEQRGVCASDWTGWISAVINDIKAEGDMPAYQTAFRRYQINSKVNVYSWYDGAEHYLGQFNWVCAAQPDFDFIDKTTQNYIYWGVTDLCKPDETKDAPVGAMLGFHMRVKNNGAGSGKPYYLVCKSGTDCNGANRLAEQEGADLVSGEWTDFVMPEDKKIAMPSSNLDIMFEVGWSSGGIIYLHDSVGHKTKRG